MANVQKEKGYLQIANQLAEAFAFLKLSETEHQILWVVLRKTYGWRKKRDRISITQFMKATGLPERSAIRALGRLLDKNIVVRSGKEYAPQYGLQKDFEAWKVNPPLRIKTLTALTVPPVSPVRENPVSSDRYKRKKDNITKDSIGAFKNSFLNNHSIQAL